MGYALFFAPESIAAHAQKTGQVLVATWRAALRLLLLHMRGAESGLCAIRKLCLSSRCEG